MAFLGIGKKEKIKEPLTEPLGKIDIAQLPNDTSLQDKGLPEMSAIEPSNTGMNLSGKDSKLFEPEKQESPSFHQASFQQSPQQQPEHTMAKDIELISSKLDYLKSAIDNLSQRLANLEDLAKSEQDQKYRW